jgi:hypothetical protein
MTKYENNVTVRTAKELRLLDHLRSYHKTCGGICSQSSSWSFTQFTSTNARALPRVRCINIMQPSNDVSYLLEAA